MKKTIITLTIIAALALSLAGCSSATAAEPETPAAENEAAEPEAQVTADVPSPAEEDGQTAEAAQTPAEGDGQNPVMNVVGVYSTDYSLEALVEAEGSENARITVTYAGSPWFHTQTVMSGRFDPETLTMEFKDSTLTEYTYNSDGSVAEETVSYHDGTGRATFNTEDNTLTITEVSPSGDVDTVYSWGPSADMKYVSDPDHYASVTAMDKFQVETVVGFNVRTAYLSENWYALADMIRYPITINDTELADANAFLGYMIDKTVSDSDREAMMNEDFLDMVVSDQSIMMGDGEILLSDPNFGTDEEPMLEVIAINGIVER